MEVKKLISVYLHGDLGEKFGLEFKFDAPNPRMVISALKYQLKGFSEHIINGSYILIKGDKTYGESIDGSELEVSFGTKRQFHLIPYIHGAGGRAGGIVKIVLGVALLGIGLAGAALAAGGFIAGLGTTAFLGLSYGSLAFTGAALAVTGVTTLFTSRPDISGVGAAGSTSVGDPYSDREDPAQRPSFFFNGPKNRAQQGGAVPLVYGHVRTGSVVVSTWLDTKRT